MINKINFRKIGTEGEVKAAEWVRKKSWTIVDMNFRKRGFEIDLIALDDKNVLRFIEVKTVIHGSCIDVAYSVYQRNMQRYFKGVEAFLVYHPELLNNEKSMDALIVNKGEILYYENVSAETVL